jgi:hypothetical protein
VARAFRVGYLRREGVAKNREVLWTHMTDERGSLFVPRQGELLPIACSAGMDNDPEVVTQQRDRNCGGSEL